MLESFKLYYFNFIVNIFHQATLTWSVTKLNKFYAKKLYRQPFQ